MFRTLILLGITFSTAILANHFRQASSRPQENTHPPVRHPFDSIQLVSIDPELTSTDLYKDTLTVKLENGFKEAPTVLLGGQWKKMTADTDGQFVLKTDSLPEGEDTIDLCVWNNDKTRMYYLYLKRDPNGPGGLKLEQAEVKSKDEVDTLRDPAVPQEIKEFIVLYKKKRPDMIFDKRLAKFANQRSDDALNGRFGGGHPVDNQGSPILNKQLMDSGFPLPPGTNPQGNNFESIAWQLNKRLSGQEALDTWSNSYFHASHLFGTGGLSRDYTYFGIGTYRQGQSTHYTFISTPTPPKEKYTDFQ